MHAERSVALRGRSALGVLKVWHRSFPFFSFFLRRDETFSAARRVAAPTLLNATLPHFRRTQTVGSIHENHSSPPPNPVFLSDFALLRAHVSACALFRHPFICQWSAARVRQPHNEPVCPRARQCGSKMLRRGRDRFSQDRGRICSVAERHQLKVCNASERIPGSEPNDKPRGSAGKEGLGVGGG